MPGGLLIQRLVVAISGDKRLANQPDASGSHSEVSDLRRLGNAGCLRCFERGRGVGRLQAHVVLPRWRATAIGRISVGEFPVPAGFSYGVFAEREVRWGCRMRGSDSAP
jgi:hypothetical protein